MTKEAYCSIQVGKLLEEKGFNKDYPKGDCTQIACTHQMAKAWLRKKHIIIVVQPKYFNIDGECDSYKVDIWTDDNYEELQENFSTYEEADEAALKYVLENLI